MHTHEQPYVNARDSIKADTGFLPRLNLKRFNFFNTCLHGWWTSNVTTFGMPIGLAASFDLDLMKRVGEVIGVESRALEQRDYATSYDWTLGLHGVSTDWLVCKDAAEVNMARHPLWGRNAETYGTSVCTRLRWLTRVSIRVCFFIHEHVRGGSGCISRWWLWRAT